MRSGGRALQTLFREHNRFLIAFASQFLKSVLPKTAVIFQSALLWKSGSKIVHALQPFLIRATCCFALRATVCGVSKRKISESGQCLQRFPRVEANGGVGIGQAINEIGVKPVAPGNFLRRLPTHSPGDKCALSRVTFYDPLCRGGDRLIFIGQFWNGLLVPGIQFLRGPGQCFVEMTKVARVRSTIGDTFRDGR